MVAAGEVVPARHLISDQPIPTTTGRLNLWYFTAERTEDIVSMTLWTSGTAAAATPTLCRFGVYEVDGAKDLTLLAAIANDTSLFASTYTAYTRSLTTTFSKVKGQRYAIGLLVVTATTAPTMFGAADVGLGMQDEVFAIEPRLASQVSGQTDLPASIASASLSASRRRPMVRLLPL